MIQIYEWWFLRSPGNLDWYAASVYGSGKTYQFGFACYDEYGIRPAMWIKD